MEINKINREIKLFCDGPSIDEIKNNNSDLTRWLYLSIIKT